MQYSGKSHASLKKAYEIGYALFRIGAKINHSILREYLERQAIELLSAATSENEVRLSMVANGTEYLVRFGSDVGIINEANAETIIVQLNALQTAIAGSEKIAGPEEVSLENIFTNQEEPIFREVASGNPAIRQDETENGNGMSGIIKSAVRQTAIIQKIRESGNCRLKDIQEILPDTSERTIRYDLQSLIEQNIIERVGSGGPSVFYRVKQVIPGVQEA